METYYETQPAPLYRKVRSLKETFTFTIQKDGFYSVQTGSLESYIGAHWQRRFSNSDELISYWNIQKDGWFYFPCESMDFGLVN